MLKTIRHNRGITQRVLGERVYRSSSQIARYEKRTSAIPPEILSLLAKQLNVNKLLLRTDNSTIKKKRRIILVGRSDSGKSTLGNFLLGKSLLPTGYGPLTKLITYVHHTSDRPDWLNGNYHVLNQKLNPNYFPDASHYNQHMILTANRSSITRYTHRYSNLQAAKYLFIFSNAPILRYCSIVDLPGLDHSDEDTDRIEEVVSPYDSLIYLSSYISFMGDIDIKWLSQRLKTNKTQKGQRAELNSLFIVLSHAYPDRIRDDDIEHCFIQATRRFRSRVPMHLSKDSIRHRMYPFLREMQRRNHALEHAVLHHLAGL